MKVMAAMKLSTERLRGADRPEAASVKPCLAGADSLLAPAPPELIMTAAGGAPDGAGEGEVSFLLGSGTIVSFCAGFCSASAYQGM